MTVTSKSNYISHFKMIGFGRKNYVRVQTSMETDNDQQSCTMNWRYNKNGGNANGRAGKFIVTYSDTKPVYTYNISYELNGGTNAAGNPSTYDKGTGVASLAAPTRTGYTFGGWYDNAGFQGDAVTSIPTTATGDVTLYAKWTANTYTVAYDANGGSGTMSNQTFTYDAAQNLRANTFTYTGKLFDGWKDNNNNSYSASQSVSNLTATNGATVTLYAQWKTDPGYITGTGTDNDPYVISSTKQWETFATESNAATYWASGVYIKLGANITGVTTRIGTTSHKFSGTFDGSSYTLSVSYSDNADYCAPFSYTDGATITNLTVGGTITTTHTHAAGLIGYAYGTTTITDCHSSVTINSNISGDGTHAGFIACTSTGSTTNITNCVFDGNIVSTNGKTTDSCGGFVGWKNNTVNISNCLLKANMSTIGSNDSYTFVRRGDGNVSIENSYYITALGTVQGTQAYTSRQSFPCKSATILGNTVYYAADLTPFGKTSSYTPDGTASKPYIISTTEGWNYLCDALQDNDTWNRFSGATVKLAGDISVTRMAGSSGHDFCGTFDGDRHTLTFNYGTAETPASVQNVAPFSYVSNTTPVGSSTNSPAAISNLHVAGHIYTSAKYAAGIVGQHWGTLNIENCRSSIVIHSSKQGDGTHGGIEGASNDALSITGCLFDGKLLTTNATTHCAGFVGWRTQDVSIANCLYAPATPNSSETWVGTSGSATFARNGATISNCYYTQDFNDGMNYTGQGKEAYGAGAAPVGEPIANGTYSVSGITAYANGLMRGETFYYGGGDNVSVSFVNENGGNGSHEAIALDKTMNTLSEGWYYVGKDISYTQGVTLTGEANIILADGKTMTTSGNSYGIDGSSDGSLTIYGQALGTGILNATGIATKGVGICTEGNVTINGGKVNANGTNDVGIRSTDGVTINRGTVTTTGIMADGDITINGGKFTATDDPGICSNSGTVTLGWTSAGDRIHATSYSAYDAVKIADGQSLHNGSEVLSGTVSDLSKLNGKTLIGVDVLQDAATNDITALATRLGGKQTNVVLAGRKLWKDGAWNTLCLPFDLGDPDAANGHHFDGTPLEGATLMTLGNSKGSGTGFDATTGTLTLYFVDADRIEAGVPYIVKWPATTPNYVENPVFTGVTVENGLHDVAFTGVAFKGTYAKQEYTEENKSILFLGAGNNLYYPQPSDGKLPTIGAFRAYFELSGTTQARQFVLNFGDGSEDTGIVSISKESGNQGNNPEFLNSLDYYTLDGVKLDGKPTKKGLYIHGGKRVVVK